MYFNNTIGKLVAHTNPVILTLVKYYLGESLRHIIPCFCGMSGVDVCGSGVVANLSRASLTGVRSGDSNNTGLPGVTKVGLS